jgi:hypothetical protein
MTRKSKVVVVTTLEGIIQAVANSKMIFLPPRKETHPDTLVTTSFWKLGLPRPGGNVGGFILMFPENIRELKWATLSKSGLSIRFAATKDGKYCHQVVDFRISRDNYRLVLKGPEGEEVYSLNGPDA